MALTIRLTPRAIRDLREIRAYLTERSPRGADNVRLDIDRTLLTLADFPGVAHECDIPGVRVLATSRYPYLVYHALRGNELVVLHVRHGSRSPVSPGDLT
jgi:plasmid stabilization system protein ParE